MKKLHRSLLVNMLMFLAVLVVALFIGYGIIVIRDFNIVIIARQEVTIPVLNEEATHYIHSISTDNFNASRERRYVPIPETRELDFIIELTGQDLDYKDISFITIDYYCDVGTVFLRLEENIVYEVEIEK